MDGGNSIAITGNRWDYITGLTIDDVRGAVVVVTNLLSGTISETSYVVTGYVHSTDRSVAVDDSGNVYFDFYKQGECKHSVFSWASPYSAAPTIRVTENTGTTAYYLALQATPDQTLLVATEGGNTAWKYPLASGARTEIDNDGYAIHVASLSIERHTQRLWLIGDPTGSPYLLGYNWPYDSAPAEKIPLGAGSWATQYLAITADDQIMAVCGAAGSPRGFYLLTAPFTSSSVPDSVASPDTGDVVVVTVPTSLGYADATGLTLTADAQSMTPSGDAVQTVTRLAWTASSAVFALTITCPVPEGVTFVSATDGGTYDSDTRVVTWFLGTKTGGSSGYVELTTEVA
jgi:hypothetical protein